MRVFPLYLINRGLFAFAIALATTLSLVYQVETVGLSPLQLVLVGTTLEVVAFVAQVPTGIIADLYSRRLSVIIGQFLIGGGFLIVGLVPDFYALLVAQLLWGTGATCVDGAEEAWLTDELDDEERVGQAFARGAQVGQIATVLGIVLATGLASIRLNLPIVVGGAVFLVLGVLLVFAMSERNFTPAPPGERQTFAAMRAQLVSGSRVLRGRTVLMCLVAATFFVGLGSEGWDRLWQAHFLKDLQFPAFGTPVLWFGTISVASMLGSVLLTELVRRRTKGLRADLVGGVLLVLQALQLMATVGFALTGQFWLAVATSLAVALFRATSQPVRTAWMAANSDSASRATVFSLDGLLDSGGQILGGPPVGLVGERSSIGAGLGASAILTAPALLLIGIGLRSERGRAWSTARRSR